jgi:thioredoxin reductase
MLQYDLTIIGGGASGLSAGVSALRNGIKKVLILERENDLGGNLNLFIHMGFGRYYLEKDVTGPELSSKLIKEYKALGGVYKVNTEVLEVTKNKVVSYVNPQDGIQEIKASSIILASGRRERFTGNINIPVHKYTGIFTLASAHRLINLQGFLPGKEIVIIGNNNWSLIIARRLLIEGARVNAIIDDSRNGFLDENGIKFIEGFNIDIIRNCNVLELYGNERIESIDIENLEDGSIKNIGCDSLILTVGYYPEISFMKKTNILLEENNIPLVKNYETSINGIFACGTLLTGDKGILNSGENGYEVGKIVSEYIKKYMY